MNSAPRLAILPSLRLSLALFTALLLCVPALSQLKTDLPAYQEMLDEENQVVSAYDDILNTVVCLEGMLDVGAASGSGIIVSKDGLILTAAHVVDGADEVGVQLVDGTRVMAKVLGCNRERDIAMVKIIPEDGEPAREWAFAEIGDSTKWKATDVYIALGHAGGYDVNRPPPVRIGRAYNNNDDGDFIVTDCVVIGGDSGGGLFDLHGKLIGIHSFIGAGLGENNHAPVHAVKEDWERLLKGDKWGMMDFGIFPEREGDEDNEADGKDDADDKPAEKKNIPFDEVDPEAFGTFLEKKFLQALGEGKNPEEIMADPVELLREFGVPAKDLRRVKEEDIMKLVMAAMGMEGAEPFSEEALEGLDIPEGLDLKAFEKKLMSLIETEDLSYEQGRELMVENGADEKALEALSDIEFSDMLNRMLGGPAMTEQEKKDQVALRDQFERCLEGHQPAMEIPFESTVGVFDRGTLRCHGVVVDPRGFILTKASEIKGAKRLSVQIQGKTGAMSYMASPVKEWKEHDLALVFIEANNLKAIQWETTLPPVGSFIASPNYDESRPIGIGLVAVAPRSLSSKNRPFLGIGLGFEDDQLFISEVMPNSPAKAAGLKADDVILTLNGDAPENVTSFIRDVGSFAVGDTLELGIRRGEKDSTIKVVLGNRQDILDEPDEADEPNEGGNDFDRMNEMSGEMSEVRTGFPTVFQTDLPVDPDQMGGPVVDLQGKVIGLNIARAGRIETYAIPGSVVLDLLAKLNYPALAKSVTGEQTAPANPKAATPKPGKAAAAGDRMKELEAALDAIKQARQALNKAERATKEALEAVK